MDLKDEKTKKIIQDIFQGKGNNVVKMVLNKKIDLPLDIIKLAIEHQIWNVNLKRGQRKQGQFIGIDIDWVQALAYSTDVGVEDYVYELFLKHPEIKGIILLTLSAINLEKATYWLKILKEIDPLFITLKLPDSSFVRDMCQKYECSMKDLFQTIIFSAKEGSDEQKIEKRLSFIIKSKANTPDEDELKLVYDERRRILASGKLTPSQADEIFVALWNANVEIKNSDKNNFFQRDPVKFFRSLGRNNHDRRRFIENGAEVKDLINTLPFISDKYFDKVKLLFDSMPIWIKKYKNISECMYRFDKDEFYEGWEKLLIKEVKSSPNEEEHFIFSTTGLILEKKNHRGKTYLPALDILDIMHKDNYKGIKSLLLELIEHPSPLVREKVKELLSK